MKKTLTLLAVTLPLILLAGAAQASDEWLHVRVVDQDSDGQRVSINIPMQMIEALVPTIETRELHDGILSTYLSWVVIGFGVLAFVLMFL